MIYFLIVCGLNECFFYWLVDWLCIVCACVADSSSGNGIAHSEHSTTPASSSFLLPSTPPSSHSPKSDHYSKNLATPLVIETPASPPETLASPDTVKAVAPVHIRSGSPENDGISSTPPSPDPFSLNINFANMTPVELPALKTKPRRSLDREVNEPKDSNASVPNISSTNPFDQHSDLPDEQLTFVAPPLLDSSSTNPSLNNAQTPTPKISDRKDSTESTVSPLPSKSSAPAPRRRSSVSSSALQMNGLKSSPPPQPSYEISRSSSQSGGLVASSAKSSGNLVEGSPLSTRSGHSMASSYATGSVSSLGREDAGAIGAMSGGMVRGGSVKEKRASDPVEDEWERKLCGRRSSE